jgi:hypothetical protein
LSTSGGKGGRQGRSRREVKKGGRHAREVSKGGTQGRYAREVPPPAAGAVPLNHGRTFTTSPMYRSPRLQIDKNRFIMRIYVHFRAPVPAAAVVNYRRNQILMTNFGSAPPGGTYLPWVCGDIGPEPPPADFGAGCGDLREVLFTTGGSMSIGLALDSPLISSSLF